MPCDALIAKKVYVRRKRSAARACGHPHLAARLELEAEREELGETRAELDEERTLRIKAQQFIVDPIFKTPV